MRPIELAAGGSITAAERDEANAQAQDAQAEHRHEDRTEELRKELETVRAAHTCTVEDLRADRERVPAEVNIARTEHNQATKELRAEHGAATKSAHDLMPIASPQPTPPPRTFMVRWKIFVTLSRNCRPRSRVSHTEAQRNDDRQVRTLGGTRQSRWHAVWKLVGRDATK